MGSSYVPGHYEETQYILQVRSIWQIATVAPTETIGGVITLGNILEIVPFDDPTVVLELDGESLWDALEAGLSKYPAQEGQVVVPFPC